MARVHVVVHGLVQGVGFRWFVREAARRHQLAGWVRNNADGSVEVCAEGADASCNALLTELRRGPPGANVAEVRELPPGAEALPSPFAIER